MRPRRVSLPLVVGCLGLVGAVAYTDYITGVQLRVFPLYFIAIAIAGWHGSRLAAVGIALISTIAWESANSMIQAQGVSRVVWALNTLTQLIAFTLTAVLIAELRRRLEHEAEVSRTDALTTLHNTRGFNEQAELVLAIGQRDQRPITVAYIDLDNFKAVNDAHGHAAGDVALQHAAAVLRTSLRASDVVGRLGGDEFAAILHDTDLAGARAVLERVRTGISAGMRERGWPVTASVGAITFADPPATLDLALRAADQLMYEVKQAGKDRVHVEHAAPPQTSAKVSSTGRGSRGPSGAGT